MSSLYFTCIRFLRHDNTVIDDISDVHAAANPDDGDGDDNTSSDFGSCAGSGLSSAAVEEGGLVERMKQAEGFWLVITTAVSW